MSQSFVILRPQIQHALEEMFAAIEGSRGGAQDSTVGSSRVAAAVREVGRLQGELGADAPSMLVHYLQQRSYAKALQFLETDHADIDKSQCG